MLVTLDAATRSMSMHGACASTYSTIFGPQHDAAAELPAGLRIFVLGTRYEADDVAHRK